MDGLCEFVRAYPAWVRDGLPLSWRHFGYGMAHLGRAAAAESLRVAAAVAMSFMPSDEGRAWRAQQKRAAGLIWERG